MPLQHSEPQVGIKPWGGLYRVRGLKRTTSALGFLDDKHAYTLFNHNRRWDYLLKPYIWTYLIVLAFATFAIFRTGAFCVLNTATLGLMATPLVLLLLPLVSLPSGGLTTLFTVGVTAVFAFGLGRLRQYGGMLPLAAVCGVTAAVVLVDVLSGGQLMTTSPLGYSPIVGARYYGIGNEYAGVLLGASLVGLGAAGEIVLGWVRTERRGMVQLALLTVLTAVLYVVAAPTLGANLGATISAAAGFSTAAISVKGRPLGWRALAAAGAAAAAAVVALGAWELSRPVAAQTHIGQAFAAILNTEGKALFQIAERKLQMNLKLFRWTLWSRVLVASAAVFAALVYRPVGIFARITKRWTLLAAALTGIAALTVVAFIVNDSGVVFGALSMLYGASTLIYLVAGEMESIQERDRVDGPA
jgi:hypothetical protein